MEPNEIKAARAEQSRSNAAIKTLCAKAFPDDAAIAKARGGK